MTIKAVILVATGFSACSNIKGEQETAEKNLTENSHHMNNLVSIVEIPTTDFTRALKFYQTILGVAIEEVDMEGMQMGVLPSDGNTVSVVLVKGNDYKPSADGPLVYLNMGNDLQPTLDNIAKNGGRIMVPKTEISAEMGYFALFIDSEGNKLGLHSSN